MMTTCCHKKLNGADGTTATVVTILSGIGLAILPKCPACCAAYASIFTAFSLSADTLARYRFVMALLLAASILLLVRRALINRRAKPLIFVSIAMALAIPSGNRLFAVFNVIVLWLVITVVSRFSRNQRATFKTNNNALVSHQEKTSIF